MRYTQNPRYTYTKNSTYYFSKSVPKDIRSYYSKQRIVLCLHTQERNRASQAAKAIHAKLEDYWLKLRLKDLDVPAAHLLNTSTAVTAGMPTIDDALDVYIQTKGTGRSKTFRTGTERSVGYLKDCLGTRSIDKYSTRDAGLFRDWLANDKKLAPASIQRVFNTIKAVTNLAIQELGLDVRNPFAGVYLKPVGPSNRKPVSKDNLKLIQLKCRELGDEMRLLVSLISDTGMRLAEATGLCNDDLVLDGPVPHISLKPHAWRSLKTPSSKRLIPLVGESLWAANVIKNNGSDFCFPRYTNANGCNSNSASAALNKWIQSEVGKGNVIHGLRHSFRDRLRAVNAPLDMVDQLGGWSMQSVGQGYGDGYPLEVMAEIMRSALEQ